MIPVSHFLRVKWSSLSIAQNIMIGSLRWHTELRVENQHHCHNHDDSGSERRLGLALALTVVYMLIEATGGFLFNSLALLADSGHMLSDSMALGLSLLAIRIGKKGPNDRHTFGLQRSEILAALFNGLALWVIVAVIFYEALQRLYDPVSVQGRGMLLVALIGLIINLVMAALLYRSSTHSINVRGAFLHVVSDALGSLGAVVAGIVIIFTQFYWVDPLVSMLIGALIIYSSWELVSESFHILMEGVPKGYDVEKIERAMASIEGVCCVYDLHVWSIAGSEVNLSAHVVLSNDTTNPNRVLNDMNQILRGALKVAHTTIQIESSHDLRWETSREKCRPGTSCSAQ